MKKIVLTLFIVLMLVMSGAGAAKIVKFDGKAADVDDQTNHIYLGLGQVGNVTVMFTGLYTLDNTTTTLKIKVAYNTTGNGNLTKIGYNITGDSANVSVKYLDKTLIFTYSGNSTANVTNIELTFDYGCCATGIIPTTTTVDSKVLAYVYQVGSTTYNTSTTPEKVVFTVYDPFAVYSYSGTLRTADGEVKVTISESTNTVKLDLSKADTNNLLGSYTFDRGATTIPVERAYMIIGFNKYYFTDLKVVSEDNAINIGYTEAGTYKTVKFKAINVSKDVTAQISVNAWDTNGTKTSGLYVGVMIDPKGGILYTYNDYKSVNVTTAAAVSAPPTVPLFWEQYQIAGYSILVWIMVAFLFVLVAIIAWRKSQGLPILPKSFSAYAALFAVLAMFTIFETLSQYYDQFRQWAGDNWLLIVVVLTVAAIFVGVFFVDRWVKE